MAEDEIEIDFSKIKAFFKPKKEEKKEAEVKVAPKVEEKKDEFKPEIKAEVPQEKKEEPKKEVKVEKPKEDEDGIDINLDGLKNLFSKLKSNASPAQESKEKPQVTDSDDITFDIKKIKQYVKQYNTVLWTCAVLFILVFAYLVRTADVPNLQNSMLIELDSYLFYRYAGYIKDGTLPDVDLMRYYPTGADTHYESLMPSYVILFTYYIGNFFNSSFTLMQAAIYYPAIFSTLSLLFFFLLAKELFNNKWTAIIATAFLAFCPAIMFRSSAGFADKESIAIVFIFAAFYCYLKADHSKDKTKTYIFAAASGFLTSLAGTSWGGFVSVPIVIGIYNFFLIMFSKMDKQKFAIIVIWLVSMTPMLMFGTERQGGINMVGSEWYFIPLFSIICSLVYITKPLEKLKLNIKLKNLHVSNEISSIIIGSLLVVILATAVFGLDYIGRVINSISFRLVDPMGAGVFKMSVSENQAPVFYDPYGHVDWWSNFEYFFITFMIGTVMLFFFAIEKLKKYKWILTVAFAVFLIFFIFSNFSTDPKYSDFNDMFGKNYWYSLYIFFGLVVMFYLFKWHKIDAESKSAVKTEYILLAIWVVLQVVVARGAIRLLYAFAPPAMLASGFFITKSAELVKKATKDKLYSISFYVVAILICYWAVTTSYLITSNMGPSMTYQWEVAMQWVRENTPTDSVFAHWWDYGYYLQSVGERATNLDGGNYMVERNELIGGHVFAAYNNTEALEALEFFGNPDYFLIVDDDVFKYYQISRIGGKPAWFRDLVFRQSVRNTQADKEEFPYLTVYEPVAGAIDLQEDITYDNVFLKGSETYIVRVDIPVNENGTKMGQPYVYVYNSRLKTSLGQYAILRSDVFCEQKVGCTGNLSESQFPGAFLFLSGYGNADETGKEGILYIPKRGMDHLFTKLYLLQEPNILFEEVYNSGYPLTLTGLHSQGDPTNIRIYKINYNITE